MNETIVRLWSFIRLLIKRWILLLIFYGSLIGAIFIFRIVNIIIPPYIFWIIAIIGLFWASFQVYRKLYIDHEGLQKKYETLRNEITTPAKGVEVKPELSIMLLEGNEYTFKLGDRCSSRKRDKYSPDGYILNEASIDIHIRIKNVGSIEVDIISIKAEYNKFRPLWDILPHDLPKERDLQKVIYPRHLGIQDIMLCDLESKIEPSILLNNAQFASRLTLVDDEINIDLDISVEARVPSGEIHNFSFYSKVSTRQLIDLYITKWQEEERTNLLRLVHPKEKIIVERKPENDEFQE